MKIKKLLKEIEGVFIPPKKSYYFGKIIYGNPYFDPTNFIRSIIEVRKLKLNTQEYLDSLANSYMGTDNKFSNMPMVRRSKNWTIKIFNNYYYITIGWPIHIGSIDLGWKDKYETPRFEWFPSFQIYFFNWQFCVLWEENDKYYEQILWYLHYADKNIKKAKETWPWRNGTTKESTWNNKYLI